MMAFSLGTLLVIPSVSLEAVADYSFSNITSVHDFVLYPIENAIKYV